MTTEPTPPEGLEEIIPPWLITGFEAWDAEIAASWRIFKGWQEEEEEEGSKQSSAAKSSASSSTSLTLDELEELIRRYPEIALAIAEAKQAELEAYLEQNVAARFAYMEHQAELLYLIGQLSQQDAFEEVEEQIEKVETATKEAAVVIVEAVEEQSGFFGNILRTLGEAMPEAISWGMELFFDVLAKVAAPAIKPLLDTMEATERVPPELQPFIDELKEPSGEIGALFAQSAGSALIGGSIGRLIDSLLAPMSYDIASARRPLLLAMPQYVDLWLRGNINDEELNQYLGWLGVDDREQERLKALSEIRFDPSAVTQLWLRGFPSEEEAENWWNDLREQGWTEHRIAAAQELAHYLPSPTEVMTWAAREVFEPELREKYQLDKFMPEQFLEWAAKVGITGEVAKNYWAAHWELPSLSNIVELWRRKVIDKEVVDDFWTEMDMVPWIREHLFKLFRAVPTRVDVRRWWDMGTIDEARLRDIYQAMGFWEEDLEDYVIWTKVYTAYPDLVARFKNGWLSLEAVKGELVALGMPEARADLLLETKFKKEKPERTVKERDLTQAQIYKGVKKEVITWGEGIDLLQQLGYDEFEADYILTINAPAEEKEKEVKTRELTKADILKGLKTEVISEGEALSRLTQLRYVANDAVFLLDVFKAAVTPPVEPREREASKADILTGVKKGLLTAKEGYLMLLDIGFSTEASTFILEVRAEESPFSPTTPSEFRRLIESYRRSQGMEAKEIAQEVIDAERELARIDAELSAAKEVGAELDVVDKLQVARVEAQVKLRELYILHEPPPPE